MSKLFWQILKVTPAVVLSSAFIANATGSAFAQTVSGEEAQTTNVNELLQQVEQYNQQGNSQDQVTSVTQFRDVQPTDWAYEALRGLVERYGCIEGYPDGTYRGNRALTRYEFAAGLFSCLTQIERLIAAGAGPSGGVTQEDLLTLQRLLGEFEAELATLGTRVNNLEARLGTVEENQFSTTTKLNGEAIFGVAQAFGEDVPDTFNPSDFAGLLDAAGNPLFDQADLNALNAQTGRDVSDSVTTLSNRVRLNFDTSFTGRDLLRTRLQSGNVPNLGAPGVTNTDGARLSFDENTGNDIELDELFYRFPVGNRINAWVGANGFKMDDIFDVKNPQFASSGTGATSRFARYNPAVYRLGSTEGAGAGLNVGLTNSIGLDLAYLVSSDNAANPTGLNNGLFQGDYNAAAQLNFSPTNNIDLAFTYVRSWYERGGNVNLSGSTSSFLSENPFAFLNFDLDDKDDNVTANRFGAQANVQLGERFSVGGWYGLVDAQANEQNADATITNWAAHASLQDLGREGSVLGAVFGQLPKITDSRGLFSDVGGAAVQDFEENDTSYLLEVLYKYPLSQNILLTPSFYTIFNPNNNNNNDNVYVGVLRTTFKF